MIKTIYLVTWYEWNDEGIAIVRHKAFESEEDAREFLNETGDHFEKIDLIEKIEKE